MHLFISFFYLKKVSPLVRISRPPGYKDILGLMGMSSKCSFGNRCLNREHATHNRDMMELLLFLWKIFMVPIFLVLFFSPKH